MALIDCPECNHGFSEQAVACPQCGFPNSLGSSSGGGRGLVRQGTVYEAEQPAGDFAGGYSVPAAVSPAPTRSAKRPQRATIVTTDEVDSFDNTLSGFFHGRTYFWFGLCVYYLGGLLAIGVVAAALGGPAAVLMVGGGWFWIGLFLLFWNAKNFEQESSKWIARIIIAMLLLSMVGAAVKS